MRFYTFFYSIFDIVAQSYMKFVTRYINDSAIKKNNNLASNILFFLNIWLMFKEFSASITNGVTRAYSMNLIGIFVF